jgi:DNA-binding NarL/FixJ family response regulator
VRRQPVAWAAVLRVPASSNAQRGRSCHAERVGCGLLVVDDNRSFAEVARLVLERQGERVAGIAATSAEAIELAARLRPDVMLIDISLGDECGLDLARCLADGIDSPPVIILISAYSPADVAELIAATPAAGFLPKSDLSADAIHRIVLSTGRSPAVVS